MKSIVDRKTGKFLYCRLDEPTEVNEVAIDQTYDLENPEGKEIFYNFETQEFYIQ
jgi:hypothetical protein